MVGLVTDIESKDGALPSITNEQIADILISLGSNQELLEILTFFVASSSLLVAAVGLWIAYIPLRLAQRRSNRQILFLRIQWFTALRNLRRLINILKTHDYSDEAKALIDSQIREIRQLSNQCMELSEKEQYLISEIYIGLEGSYIEYLLKDRSKFALGTKRLEKDIDRFYSLLRTLKTYPSL